MAPAELEDVLRGLEGVGDVAVIGVPSEREGEPGERDSDRSLEQ